MGNPARFALALRTSVDENPTLTPSTICTVGEAVGVVDVVREGVEDVKLA